MRALELCRFKLANRVGAYLKRRVARGPFQSKMWESLRADSQTRRPEPNAHQRRLRLRYGRSHCFIFSSCKRAATLWSCQKRLGYQALIKVLLLLHGPATFKRSEPGAVHVTSYNLTQGIFRLLLHMSPTGQLMGGVSPPSS